VAVEILIIRLSALGDVVTTLPLASAIKRHLPGSRVTWLVEKAAAPLLINNPIIDRVIIFPGKSLLPALAASPPAVNRWQKFRDFWLEFKSQHYDIAIDAQGLFKSAFLGWLSGAKIRIGFANTREWADKFLTHSVDIGDVFSPDKHIIDSYNILANKLFELVNVEAAQPELLYPEFSLPAVPTEASQKVQSWLEVSNDSKQPVAVLIPGTTWATKIWPADKWQELGQLLIERNGYKVILCGGASEITTNNQLEQNLISKTKKQDAVLNLTGNTSLIELIALFDRVQLVIGGDTGPLHLASAVGKAKIVGIFGSTPWKRNGPYGPHSRSIALDLECQPCFSKTCRLNTIACLNELGPDYVYSQIMDFIPRPIGQ